MLREGLGRVGEAEFVEPRLPTTVDEVKDLSMDELALVIAMSCANEIRAVVDEGDGALRLELERWEPETRADVGPSPRRSWLNDHPDLTLV